MTAHRIESRNFESSCRVAEMASLCVQNVKRRRELGACVCDCVCSRWLAEVCRLRESWDLGTLCQWLAAVVSHMQEQPRRQNSAKTGSPVDHPLVWACRPAGLGNAWPIKSNRWMILGDKTRQRETESALMSGWDLGPLGTLSVSFCPSVDRSVLGQSTRHEQQN